jgi:hypothetical protein
LVSAYIGGIGLFTKPIFEPIPQKLLVIIILGIGFIGLWYRINFSIGSWFCQKS